jgi:hypothetical protein
MNVVSFKLDKMWELRSIVYNKAVRHIEAI